MTPDDDMLEELEARGHYGVLRDCGFCAASVFQVGSRDGMLCVSVMLFPGHGRGSARSIDVLFTGLGNALVAREDALFSEQEADAAERAAIGVVKRWRARPARFMAPDAGPCRDLRAD